MLRQKVFGEISIEFNSIQYTEYHTPVPGTQWVFMWQVTISDVTQKLHWQITQAFSSLLAPCHILVNTHHFLEIELS